MDIKITRLNSLFKEIFLSNFINFINETINFLIELSMRFEVRLKKKRNSTFQYMDIIITLLNSLSKEIFLSNFINLVNETINFNSSNRDLRLG